ncbi:MAG: putative drug resistance efflux protein [Glaciihabitans sp.]|nr:putative drug resistance efflux protein [Glaciihabitans sp.]
MVIMQSTITPTQTGPTTGPAHPTAILAIILVSYFMILLDASIVFTGLPSIQRDLGLSTTELPWVQDAYVLVFGGFLLLGARAGDILGRRRVFITGLVIFTLASVLVALAPTDWWLIGSRALQGLGAAVVAPASLSLLTASFAAGASRNRAVAWYAATAGIGSSLGMVIGGAFADTLSWRAGFWVNLPIGILMIALAPRYLPATARSAGRFDFLGAISATLGMGSLVFGIVNSAEAGWGASVTISTIIIGVVLLALFVVIEWRAEQPIMPLRLFRSRERSGAYAARMLYLGAMIGFFYFTTQFMQGVLGFSPLQAGLAFLPMTAVNFVVALANPRLVNRFGNTLPLIGGVLFTLGGMLWLSSLTVDSGYLSAVALPMVLIGIGQGLAFAPLTAAGISGVSTSDAGAASGLVNTAHQLGMALGLGILVAVSASAAPAGASVSAALTAQVATALGTGSIFLALCLATVLALVLPATLAAGRRAGS